MNMPAALRQQAGSCDALGSPFMAALLTGLADHWPEESELAQYFAEFTGDIGSHGHSLPLRLAGGLHALVLTGRDAALAELYPPHDTDSARLIPEVLAALDRHSDFLLDWCQLPPQTNEVRRSAALVPAGHLLAARFGLPMDLSELGASGGLNLMWDQFAIVADGQRLGPKAPALTHEPDWSGPVPPSTPVTVAERRGVDLNPLDASDPDHALRLRAYLWPDQPHRMRLTEAAIAAQDAAVDRADVIDWLAGRLANRRANHLHLIYHTVAWQYFPADAQARGTAMIEAAGARATEDRPLAWLSMESDGGDRGAAVTLRLWPGDERHALGRADFHGRWVEWATAAT